jgi:hypothetical protein
LNRGGPLRRPMVDPSGAAARRTRRAAAPRGAGGARALPAARPQLVGCVGAGHGSRASALSLSRRAALSFSFSGCSLRRLVDPPSPGRRVVTRGFSGAVWADSQGVLEPTADMVTGWIGTRTTPGFFRTSLFPASGFSPGRVFPGAGFFSVVFSPSPPEALPGGCGGLVFPASRQRARL